MIAGTTFIFGQLSVLAERRLPQWTRSFITRIVDRFPPVDEGGLPPRIRIISSEEPRE